MNYEVVIKKKVVKNLRKLPLWVQKKMALLLRDLKENGPEQPKWQNYGKLNEAEYHCHLGTSWVACWHHQQNMLIIEVYYAGSREKAPY